MNLRLLIEVQADAEDVAELAELVDVHAVMDVAYPTMETMRGRLVGAVPVEQGQEVSAIGMAIGPWIRGR